MDEQALAALAALGQDTRLEVFRLLVRAGTAGVPAGEIASNLGTVQNTTSAHLKVLDQAGLVRAERDGPGSSAMFRRDDWHSRPCSPT